MIDFASNDKALLSGLTRIKRAFSSKRRGATPEPDANLIRKHQAKRERSCEILAQKVLCEQKIPSGWESLDRESRYQKWAKKRDGGE
jgi:hypothetical protein